MISIFYDIQSQRINMAEYKVINTSAIVKHVKPMIRHIPHWVHRKITYDFCSAIHYANSSKLFTDWIDLLSKPLTTKLKQNNKKWKKKLVINLFQMSTCYEHAIVSFLTGILNLIKQNRWIAAEIFTTYDHTPVLPVLLHVFMWCTRIKSYFAQNFLRKNETRLKEWHMMPPVT